LFNVFATNFSPTRAIHQNPIT